MYGYTRTKRYYFQYLDKDEMFADILIDKSLEASLFPFEEKYRWQSSSHIVQVKRVIWFKRMKDDVFIVSIDID